MRLIARDLGFTLVDTTELWPLGGLSPSGARSSGRAPRRVAPADLSRLQVENDWLIRICHDYTSALARAGQALGLGGWVALTESSGVLLEASPMTPLPEDQVRPEPQAGVILSLASAGPNPVGLALDRVAVVLLPPEGGSGGKRAPVLYGLAVPLGDPAVPIACLAVLLPPRPQPAAQALLGQALFSARAVELALALRSERSANLQVAAGLAHEVRNPLTAVKGFLELTLAHRSEVPQFAGVALRELDRAISLLEDYSLLSRAPKIQPTQAVSVSGLLSEAALVARGLTTAGPEIIIDHTDSEPGLQTLADPPRLKQVLLNLCRNAVEAMPEGGILRLRALREGREVVLEVSDTGVGVPSSEKGRIFEPFYTTKETGTGLGLSVCRRIVEAHGGRLTLHSQPGHGTSFRVHLPLHFRLVEGKPPEG